MKIKILLFLILMSLFCQGQRSSSKKNDFKDILDLDGVKADQDYFSQAIIQYQLLEKIMTKYGAIYHLYPKENPSLFLKRKLKTVKDTLQFDIDNGVPSMVLFGNTSLDGNTKVNEINENLYQLGVDRCQFQIPMSLDELDGGFQFNHYMFSSKNKAALDAFGIVKNNYDSESLYIVIDYIQFKDNQCPGLPKIRYGVGIRSEIRISNWNNKLDIKESSLAGLAANAEINGLKVNITVKTIGITGLDSKLNIPTNTSFDVNTFSDYQKIIDFIRQFNDNKVKDAVVSDSSDTNLNQNPTPFEKQIKELKDVVVKNIKQASNYENIIFKPQLLPVMDEYRTSISQSFKSFYGALDDFEKRIDVLVKQKKKYEKYKDIPVKTALDSAKVVIYEEKITAILEEIADLKNRKNDLKEANNFVYDLKRYKELLKVITNYKPDEKDNSQKAGDKNDKATEINTAINNIYNSEYYIVVAGDDSLESAQVELKKALLINSNARIIKKGTMYRTVLMGYKNRAEAAKDLKIALDKFGKNSPVIVDAYKWCSKGVTEGDECLICNDDITKK